ncbi:MAG: hypothetical protein J5J00_06345 [Deltaproteobacteria bacterium]|nr:hypothetical protein [Deltaproteobacteria bacterium]
MIALSSIAKPVYLDIKNSAFGLRQALLSHSGMTEGIVSAKRDLRELGCITSPSFTAMARSWGNESYAVDFNFIDTLGRYLMERRPRTVLETGSGLSTIILSIYGAVLGFQTVALEHGKLWQLAASKELARNKELLGEAEVLHRPLVDFGRYKWFDIRGGELPSSIDFVLCDGPQATTKGGRSGLIPNVRDRLSHDALVIMDDGARPGEQALAKSWCADYGLSMLSYYDRGRGTIVLSAPRH